MSNSTNDEQPPSFTLELPRGRSESISQQMWIRMEAAAGFLPWLISKVAPPLLPPQALSNQLNHSDKYSRRKAAGLAWEERMELALRQQARFVLIATVTCMYLN